MVGVVSKTNRPLMPTDKRRARKLLKSGRAEVYRRLPFTIKYKYDTGYQHFGATTTGTSASTGGIRCPRVGVR